MPRPLEPEEARILLENLMKVGLLQKRAGPHGQECYCFTANMAPSAALENLVAAGLLEKRTGPSGQECYCLLAPLTPPRPSQDRP
jgi:hypothetical protein